MSSSPRFGPRRRRALCPLVLLSLDTGAAQGQSDMMWVWALDKSNTMSLAVAKSEERTALYFQAGFGF